MSTQPQRCTACTKFYEGDATFCPHCGASAYVGQPSVTPAQNVPSTPPSAPVASSEAAQKAKAAVANAQRALKILLNDPLNGQEQAVSAMGETKAFQVGLVFCLLQTITAFLLAYSIVILPLRQFAQDNRSVPFEVYIMLFAFCLVPPAVLTFGFFAIGKIFGGSATIQVSTFGAGVAFLPLTAASLLAYIVGFLNIELVLLAGGCSVALFVLLLQASLSGLQKLTALKSFILTPVLILVSAYIAKVIFVMFLGNAIPKQLGMDGEKRQNPFSTPYSR